MKFYLSALKNHTKGSLTEEDIQLFKYCTVAEVPQEVMGQNPFFLFARNIDVDKWNIKLTIY